jgi:hypothetical protein
MPETRIPLSALVLGIAGLIPFVYGALTLYSAGLADWGLSTLGPRFVGPFVQLQYGVIILSFMSGVIWGFATRAEGVRAALGYGLSVVPALWAFFFVGAGPGSSAWMLIVGFIGLLGIDATFVRWGLAPGWWMRLRIGLTAVVVLALLATALR